jgi:hypothetical protein
MIDRRAALEDVIQNPYTNEADRQKAQIALQELDAKPKWTESSEGVQAKFKEVCEREIASETTTPEQKAKAQQGLDDLNEPDPDSPSYRPKASKHHEHLDNTVDLNPDANEMITLRNTKSPLWNEITKQFDRVPQPDVVITAAQFERLKNECAQDRPSKLILHYSFESRMTDRDWIADKVRGRRMLTAAGFKGHEL